MAISKINPNSLGGVPCFSAYTSISTSVATSTWTKLQNNNKEFDTAGAYDNATNYRFQPSVAGYYVVDGAWANNAASSVSSVSVYKNGSAYKTGTQILNTTVVAQAYVSALVYLNGSTDYVELYGYQSSGGTVSAYTGSQPAYGYFQGYMVRAA